ncbi:MAG: beta-ketoacyl synthase chain length factor [Betaproteobacteria bacterium]|nr:beta-ketoacyl synthase chain length factor [Betaproteobacteria bacterium]
MRVYVEGIGLLGPGLDGWPASRALLAGEAAYNHAPTIVTANDLLPAAERRRIGLPVKLALAAGHEAFMHARRDAATTATVFTSSSGDGENLDNICATLASPDRKISPTRFHNSVHNAPAGYWSIATRSQEASTSLCCHDASFAAGLLDAASQIAVEGKAVALITYDQPYPEPLNSVRTIGASFGMGMVLAAQTTTQAFAALDISLVLAEASATRMTDSGLETVRTTVPAARCLPVLAALARGVPAVVVLAYGGKNHVRVAVTPWP